MYTYEITYSETIKNPSYCNKKESIRFNNGNKTMLSTKHI